MQKSDRRSAIVWCVVIAGIVFGCGDGETEAAGSETSRVSEATESEPGSNELTRNLAARLLSDSLQTMEANTDVHPRPSTLQIALDVNNGWFQTRQFDSALWGSGVRYNVTRQGQEIFVAGVNSAFICKSDEDRCGQGPPVGFTPELLEVTGVTAPPQMGQEVGTMRIVEFTFRHQIAPELEQFIDRAFEELGEPQTSEESELGLIELPIVPGSGAAMFRLYDDGWRLEEIDLAY